ncbi:amino acid ABC transporter permease [Arthrobacter sp. ISL-28]|uniref:amino acid ABC transporter permease n=1 Tax=Arthrobacter sp. ISL-28 TaxID=2819108 RepID=UPI001BEBADAA|nr:amino acid ABC transporter permease [Arthrobacter sp. ISL-28]MBT2523085.1 amino acid ABC transporter permease [Arthrobacter sp. ISL-28]
MSFITDWLDWFPTLFDGLLLSLQITGLSLLLGLPVGLLLAVFASSRNALVRGICVGVVEISRGAPALVVLQLFYFGLPSTGITLSSFTAGFAALALTTAAFTSEILRAGLQAVPAGEIEACQTLGVSRLDTLRFVVIPQGLRIALPALMGFAILIFQATSLCFTIAVPELLSQAYSIGSSTFKYFSVLALAGLLYAAVTIPATWLVGVTEKRMSRHLTLAH